MIDLTSVADTFTVLNALFGFSAVIVALEGELEIAYALIVLAVLSDGLDGLVARRFGRRWNLGDYLDIMADTASFALAPSVLLYLTYRGGLGDPTLGLTIIQMRLVVLVAGGILITTGVMRLARFCFETGGSEPTFLGMPIPAVALSIAVAMMLELPGLLVAALTIIASGLMVSDLHWPKPRGHFGGVTGALLLLLVVTTMGGERFDPLDTYLAAVTLVGTLGYHYGGPVLVALRARPGMSEEEGEADALPVGTAEDLGRPGSGT